MKKAIGVVECNTVSAGITAADRMVKTAQVELLQSSVVCPGKYIIVLTGDLSAVTAAVDAAQSQSNGAVTDRFILGNPSDDLFPAIYGGTPVENPRSLGVLETFSVPAIFTAADTAAKTSDVTLLEIRLARGMCGKSYVLLTGDVAAVTAAIERARAAVGESGMLLDSTVIPNPDPSLWSSIL